ncbi:glycine cleavage system aminomethyltransferase GcvT [Candidatus Bathyarchaeota archaeon]|nr:glycine cleavage system aminomethyltransferase GcvT [Candidatus Bathyarchaeota archaeon]
MALKTQLFQYHVEHAHMFEFAGFQMPLWYEGIIPECLAVRKSVGAFDISHMGRIFVSGPDAEAFLNHLTTNNVAALKPNHAQYTLLCNSEGGIKDDLVIFKLEERPFLVVCNAGNRAKDLEWMTSNTGSYNVRIHEASNDVAMISVQGPRTARVLQSLCEGVDLSSFIRFDCRPVKMAGQECILSRTGYTGEDGFEVCIMNSTPDKPGQALSLWSNILRAGRELGIKPCGLGARDVLRLEAGMSLYGHDITESTDPIEAGLDFVVKLEKGDFIGKEAILRRKDEGVKRKRIGLKVTGKGIPRAECRILKNGRSVGVVTSGTFSPTLNTGIAIGYVQSMYSNMGERLSIEVHGRLLEAEVTGFPFYDPKLYGFRRVQ